MFPCDIFPHMKRLTAKKMLELWDELLKREWMKDATLASKVGLNPSTIASWRSGRNKTAHPYNVKMLSEKLGYRIELSDDGKWTIEKASDALVTQEPGSLYRAAHLSENEGGMTPDEVKLLDKLSAQLLDISKQVEELRAKKR